MPFATTAPLRRIRSISPILVALERAGFLAEHVEEIGQDYARSLESGFDSIYQVKALKQTDWRDADGLRQIPANDLPSTS